MLELSNFSITHERFLDDLKKYVAEQVCNVNLLKLWFGEIRNESQEMMEDSEIKMKNYINTIKEMEKKEESTGKDKTKGKKDKKGKDKKGKDKKKKKT